MSPAVADGPSREPLPPDHGRQLILPRTAWRTVTPDSPTRSMNETVQFIPLTRLALAFIPVFAVLIIIHRWSLGTRAGLVAVLRMVTQLLLVGYVLTFIFESNRAAVVRSVVSVMLATAGWIALRPLGDERRTLYPKVLLAISVGAVAVVVIATQGVLDLGTWHNASVVIPLAGIVLANSMNTVSLAAERFRAERRRGAEAHVHDGGCLQSHARGIRRRRDEYRGEAGLHHGRGFAGCHFQRETDLGPGPAPSPIHQ